TAEDRARGGVAASAGNHAHGVAVAARAHGVSATIVMPVTTPLAKVQATRGYGADVVLRGASYECANSEAEGIARDRGLTMIPAYDDRAVIAGQGTLGLEIVEDLPDVDLVLVPVGGSGVALRAKAPAARIVGVQVEAAPGVARSLEARALTPVPPAPTIAEGVAVAGPGDITFPLLRRVLDGVVLVGEDDVAQAIVYLLERAKLVVEGAGAVGVAALLSGLAPVKGQRVVALLSGGNVNINMLARVFEHGRMRAARYFSLTVGMDDRPAQLADLSELIAGTGANVLSVAHHRFGIALPVGRVEVVLLLEVRNRDHGVEVERALAAHGFVRNAEAGPQFVPADWVQGRP